jgi:hypothetical protein
MKRKISTIILIATLISITACNKYLNTVPTSFETPVNYYQSYLQLTNSLAGVYEPLASGSFYGEIYQYVTTNCTDEAIDNYQNTLPQIAYYNETSSDANVASLWSILYTGINRANSLLENINVAKDPTEAQRRHVKGETTFLRAYYYFMLTQWYGDVPLRLTSTQSANQASLAFTKSKDVYNFVISEMTTADSLLSDQTPSSLSYNETVTNTAVEGVLARVCLYAAGNPINDTRRYADALTWAKKVVSSGQHKLNPDYTQVFKNMSADAYDNVNRESMWEVGFYYLPSVPSYRLGSEVRVGMKTAAASIGNCYGYANIYPRLFKTYESVINPVAKTDVSPDLRREWCIPSYTWTGGDAVTLPTATPIAYNSYYDRFMGKWRREYEIQVPRNPDISPRNLPILRYSDVLLMEAEAENEVNGPTALAIDAVNQVRIRGYGENLIGKQVVGVTITNGGKSFTSVPTVTFTGGGGTGATATATITAGVISAITMSSLGSKYTSAPTVTITGGGGNSAAATTVLSNASLLPAQYVDQATFRKTIQDERLRELNHEFFRRQDLKRWGILISTMKNIASEVVSGSTDKNPDGTPVVPPETTPALQLKYGLAGQNIGSKDLYLPIPLTEMNYNNKAKQNPGF